MTTAWLIEFGSPATYYAADGDWCNNPNHAHKFATAEEANAKKVTLVAPVDYRVVEHGWDD